MKGIVGVFIVCIFSQREAGEQLYGMHSSAAPKQFKQNIILEKKTNSLTNDISTL